MIAPRKVIAFLLFTVLVLDSAAQVAVEIAPVDTDPAINRNTAPHFTYVPAGPETGQLLVFLPGTYGKPQAYQLFMAHASRQGFHVAGLTYPNDTAVNVICGSHPDSLCFDKVRGEIVSGEDLTDEIGVNRANSIENRLYKLLLYLTARYPDAGWNQYLLDDAVNWTQVIIAGHSQGGGHSGFIAKKYQVHRSLLFAALDFSLTWLNSPPWIRNPGATPPDRFFAFTHREDELVNFDGQVLSWRQYGLLSEAQQPVNTDSLLPPYHDIQGLYSRSTPDFNPGKKHGAPVVSLYTPKNEQGEPLYAPVWSYMLGSSVTGIMQSDGLEVPRPTVNPETGIVRWNGQDQRLNSWELVNALGQRSAAGHGPERASESHILLPDCGIWFLRVRWEHMPVIRVYRLVR